MARGVKYSARKRKQILAFIDKYNAEHGRGGAAEATKKFNVTYQTLRRWMEENGGKAGEANPQPSPAPRKKRRRKRRTAVKPVQNKERRASVPSREVMVHLNKIQSYQKKIEQLQKLIEKEKAAIVGLLD
jgi:uncharacterized protein (DUF2267 family)